MHLTEATKTNNSSFQQLIIAQKWRKITLLHFTLLHFALLHLRTCAFCNSAHVHFAILHFALLHFALSHFELLHFALLQCAQCIAVGKKATQHTGDSGDCVEGGARRCYQAAGVEYGEAFLGSLHFWHVGWDVCTK